MVAGSGGDSHSLSLWTVRTRNIDANGDDAVEPQNVLESGYEEEHVIQCERHEGDEHAHRKTEPNPIEPAWNKCNDGILENHTENHNSSLLAIIANSDRQHGLEFYWNQEASLAQVTFSDDF